MRKDQFKLGQRVKQKEDGSWKHGHVRQIKEKSVIIQWDDIRDWCEHFEDEFETIFFD
jgi:hypothetical protein